MTLAQQWPGAVANEYTTSRGYPKRSFLSPPRSLVLFPRCTLAAWYVSWCCPQVASSQGIMQSSLPGALAPRKEEGITAGVWENGLFNDGIVGPPVGFLPRQQEQTAFSRFGDDPASAIQGWPLPKNEENRFSEGRIQSKDRLRATPVYLDWRPGADYPVEAEPGPIAVSTAPLNDAGSPTDGRGETVPRLVEMHWRMDVPEMGEIQVHLRLEDETVRARVVVSEGSTLHLLETQAHLFRDRLTESGLTLGSFDVCTNSEGTSHQRQEAKEPPRAQPRSPGTAWRGRAANFLWKGAREV